MPALGLAQETGRLLRWIKQEGEEVAVGDLLMEIETDKSAVEIEASAKGFLRGISVQPGEDVAVGTVMAWILGEGEEAPAPRVTPVVAPAAVAAAHKSREPEATQLDQPQPGNIEESPPTPADQVAASPLARQLAQEHHLDLTPGGGSGPDGAYVAADLAATISAPVGMAAASRRMALHTTQVWTTTPHFYLGRDVRARRLQGWLEVLRQRSGEPVTYTDLLLRTVAVALRKHPQMSDYWVDGEIRHRDGAHVGLAIASPRGLLLATVRDADRLGLRELVVARRRVVERAQAGRLTGADLEGASITISNLGMFGVDRFEAVLTEGQSSLLAVGRIRDEVVPVDGRPAVEPVLSLTLSCDHRVLDGAGAAPFLITLVEYLEEPALLLDVENLT
ncbi:MAG TPA: dihydrolipoamide acetyltransferase family protein [Candidatus Acidoferrales bacterium]|nr:dihydrolipoamide acetyltransferase family protein [Candidatus Acidoferrales bacterium]